MSHTPTPWKWDKYTTGNISLVSVQGATLRAVALIGNGPDAEANAEHIVRCVNSHDALLDAIKDLAASFRDVVSDFSGDDPDEWESLNAADAIIALVEDMS